MVLHGTACDGQFGRHAMTAPPAWSGGSFGERPCVGDGAYQKCMIACGQVEIDWGQAGRSSYDRTHAEL
jgi:hypothetical protein